MTSDYPASPDHAQPSGGFIRGVVEAFSVDSAGAVRPLHDPRGASAPDGGGYLWIHLNLDECADLASGSLDLPEQVARSLLAKETRPRCRHVFGGVLINLRGVNLNEGDAPEDMLSIRCWLERDRLITVRKRRSVALEELRDRYRDGQAEEAPGGLLIAIIRGLLDKIDPFVDELADSLDAKERKASEQDTSEVLREDIAAMRHDAGIYRRYLAPMRDAIKRLPARDGECFSQKDTSEIEEEADRATRVVEELDITMERASVIVDQMQAARSERINRNMVILSVVSAIFLPLSFLTGLLGINVGGIPGADNPYAFGVVVGTCTVLGIMLGAWFRSRDWL